MHHRAPDQRQRASRLPLLCGERGDTGKQQRENVRAAAHGWKIEATGSAAAA
jgi:hypothetical protein